MRFYSRWGGALIGVLAVSYGGWYLILLWPALSLFIISLAYFRFGTVVFGKRTDGTMARSSFFVLLPYLLYLWFVWHVVRLLSREDCHHQLSINLTIGRRLLPSELPEYVDTVVDLTCEFSEPLLIRTSREYRSFPMLDGVAPSPQALVRIARQLAELNGHLYIHCAQGHGRTGLVAAALLLTRRSAGSPSAAIELIQSIRSQVRLARRQLACLEIAYVLMSEDAESLDNRE
jgi:protein-tyrosine phosphatase